MCEKDWDLASFRLFYSLAGVDGALIEELLLKPMECFFLPHEENVLQLKLLLITMGEKNRI